MNNRTITEEQLKKRELVTKYLTIRFNSINSNLCVIPDPTAPAFLLFSIKLFDYPNRLDIRNSILEKLKSLFPDIIDDKEYYKNLVDHTYRITLVTDDIEKNIVTYSITKDFYDKLHVLALSDDLKMKEIVKEREQARCIGAVNGLLSQINVNTVQGEPHIPQEIRRYIALFLFDNPTNKLLPCVSKTINSATQVELSKLNAKSSLGI